MEYELYHYGVKGMKWGKHIYSQKDDTRPRQNNGVGGVLSTHGTSGGSVTSGSFGGPGGRSSSGGVNKNSLTGPAKGVVTLGGKGSNSGTSGKSGGTSLRTFGPSAQDKGGKGRRDPNSKGQGPERTPTSTKRRDNPITKKLELTGMARRKVKSIRLSKKRARKVKTFLKKAGL